MSEPSEKLLEYDIVIIGSGAGGGTVAQELSSLCAQGVKIALLEWGGHFEKTDNNRREVEMAGKYYFDNGGFQTSTQDMTLAFAKALGGSTTVYTGVTFKPPESALRKWAVPGLDMADLAPRLDQYIAENNVHLQPPENINRNNTLFAEACQKLGWSMGQFPLNIKGCAGLNTCNIGCARHAKQGTAVVQIPKAKRNGVDVITFCRADRIEGKEIVAEVFPAEHGLAPSLLAPGRYRIRASTIVVSAGALQTTALLMRSFGEKAWPALGRYFTCHPALTLVAEHSELVEGTFGHPKSYYCDEFVSTEHFLLETCMYFPFTTAKNLAGFGPDIHALLSRYPYLQQILVLVLDEARAENRITIDAQGNPVVHYKISDELIDAFVRSIRASGRLFFAGGAKRAHLPAMANFFVEAADAGRLDELVQRDRFKLGQIAVSAAHLMGGCRMGTDPATSVTDAWGRVHGKPGLYVADASLFPGSAEVNPYLTIMALANRVAEAVKKDRSGAGLPSAAAV
jgi:choline dehydrogenase-like flavoprotein